MPLSAQPFIPRGTHPNTLTYEIYQRVKQDGSILVAFNPKLEIETKEAVKENLTKDRLKYGLIEYGFIHLLDFNPNFYAQKESLDAALTTLEAQKENLSVSKRSTFWNFGTAL